MKNILWVLWEDRTEEDKTGMKTFYFHKQVCLFPLLIYEQDMEANRSSQDFKVNVKVNAAPPEDLAKILAEIREDYEDIIEKNRQSLDNWYKEQVTAIFCSFQRACYCTWLTRISKLFSCFCSIDCSYVSGSNP